MPSLLKAFTHSLANSRMMFVSLSLNAFCSCIVALLATQNPRDEDLLVVQQKAKAKFKVLSSQLKMKAASKQAQQEGMSF